MSQPIWQPSTGRIQASQMYAFMKEVSQRQALDLQSYDALYRWSITHPADFWQQCSEFCGIEFLKAYQTVLMKQGRMIDTRWFVGGELNFAQHLLRYQDEKTAIIAYDENGKQSSYTYSELYKAVAQCAAGLKNLGVKQNDVVAGFLPNVPETIIAMLAASSLGATWTACSPDFGIDALMDRFGQVQPKILFVTEFYQFKGKKIDCKPTINALQLQLPHTKIVAITNNEWENLLNNSAETIHFAQLPFDHPLYILYSSGTTGAPKCIVHGQGGTLIQHLKELILHTDLTRKDTLFFYTTCGWMMWHWMTSALATGATLLLFEGAPTYPDAQFLWDIIAREKVTVFGTSAKYISTLNKDNIHIRQDLSALHTLLSTGAPLLHADFDYVYRALKKDLQLSSISGGTDIISCFALGCPILPVYAGELQCRGLGMDVHIFNEKGEAITEEKGELVCTSPFPSMPIYFWNDKDSKRYLNSYFAQFPNIWTHGDFAELTEHNGLIIFGRSDSVLKRHGIRIGSAEIYHPLATIPAITESIVIGVPYENDIQIMLFIVLKLGIHLNDALKKEIIHTIKTKASPRHVPDVIIAVPDLPKTRNNKLSERAVKQVVMGEAVTNKEALANPESLIAIQHSLAYSQKT